MGPRWVGILAGATATVGIVTVAAASSATVLAIGLLVAGSSTGIASPPMAAAVTQWISETRKDQAQTLVNAGTGLGVLVSGPIALALLAHWSVAWAVFGLIAALVTVAVWRFVPPGRPPQAPRGAWLGGAGGLPAGTLRLLACSALMGMGSIAVWTLGSSKAWFADLWSASAGRLINLRALRASTILPLLRRPSSIYRRRRANRVGEDDDVLQVPAS